MTDSIRRRMALGGMVSDASALFESYITEDKTWRNKHPWNAKRKGDITEMDFCTAVLKYGWEVFKNVSCVGPVDCIVMDTEGKIYKVDVKTVSTLKQAINFKKEDSTICVGFIFDNKAVIQYGKGEDDQIVLNPLEAVPAKLNPSLHFHKKEQDK